MSALYLLAALAFIWGIKDMVWSMDTPRILTPSLGFTRVLASRMVDIKMGRVFISGLFHRYSCRNSYFPGAILIFSWLADLVRLWDVFSTMRTISESDGAWYIVDMWSMYDTVRLLLGSMIKTLSPLRQWWLVAERGWVKLRSLVEGLIRIVWGPPFGCWRRTLVFGQW